MVTRGEIRWYRFEQPKKRRPVLILTRETIIPVLSDLVVAPITSTVRGIPGEVPLNEGDGMPKPCAVNFFNLACVPSWKLGPLLTRLPMHRWPEAREALLFALGFDPDALQNF